MTPTVLLIDANTTTRLLTQRALEALGAEVRALEGWDAASGVGDASLVVASGGASPEELWGWLEVPAGTPLIITAVQPERILPPPGERSAALTVLARPFTPRALCAAAVDRLPALRPAGDLPFAAEASSSSESRFDSMEMDIVVDEELQILDMEDLVLLEEDEEEEEAEEVDRSGEEGFEPISEEGELPELPELSALLQTAELESLGSTEHFDSGEASWGSAEDLPGLSGSGGYEGEPTRQPEELAPHEATRMASMESIFPAQPPRVQPSEAPDDATRMAPLPELFRAAHAGVSITPGPLLARELGRLEGEGASLRAAYSQAPTVLGLEEAPGARRPGRQLASWAVQLARDWEFIGLELDLDRRAELIQTAVVDIEPEPLGLGGLAGGLPAALAAPEPEPVEGRLQGDLGLLRPVEVLRLVREQRLTGALELHDGGLAFRLTVQGDRLRYLEPRVPDADLLLGRLLLDRGWVTPELVDVALRARDERPLGERLVLAGALTEEALQEALRGQARAYFSVICAMQQGRFVFRELRGGASLPPFGAAEPRPLNLPISTLLLEAQRESSASKARPAPPDDATRLSSAPPRPLTFGVERGKPVAPARQVQATSEEEDAAELDAIVRRLEALMPLNPYGAGEGEG